MTLKKDFLWGGAVAAHQLEGGWNAGGKGVSVADVMIAGSNGVERKITDGVIEGENYPNHEAIDFYHRYKEDIALFDELGLNCFRTSIHGLVFFQMEMKRNLMKKVCNSMMIYLMSV